MYFAILLASSLYTFLYNAVMAKAVGKISVEGSPIKYPQNSFFILLLISFFDKSSLSLVQFNFASIEERAIKISLILITFS